MVGIKETSEALSFGLKTAAIIDDQLQDGFQWFKDLPALVPSLTLLPGAIDGIEDVPKELEDLDETEREQLIQIAKEYDIEDDTAEALVEQGIRASIELSKLILMMRKSRKAKQEEE